jgi:hypothetical protein
MIHASPLNASEVYRAWQREASLLERWPHLRPPGRQPWNEDVAPTLQEQCQRLLGTPSDVAIGGGRAA